MSSYEQAYGSSQQPESNQMLPVVTGREMGMQLNRTAEAGATSWQIIGGDLDEYGRAPATTTWVGVGALEANPLATSFDMYTGVRQDLHAVVYVPGIQKAKPAYLGVVGVNVRGQEGVLLVTLPSKTDPALVVDGYSHLNPAIEQQPTRQIGNTIISYEPTRGIVTITSQDKQAPSLIATAEQPMPRDTSILGDSWTLPSQNLCNAFNSEWPAVQEAQNRVREWVQMRGERARAEARAAQPQAVAGVAIEGMLIDASEPLGEMPMAEAIVVKQQPQPEAFAEQPTLQNVYAAAQEMATPMAPDYSHYAQQQAYTGGFTAVYGNSQPAAEDLHPYYQDEQFNYQ